MTWQRPVLIAIALMSIPVFYAPYEWGTEEVKGISRREYKAEEFLKQYPKRQRQFLFGDQTRIAPAPFYIPIQRRLVVDQLVLECWLMGLFALVLWALLNDRQKVCLRSSFKNFDERIYAHAVGLTLVELPVTDNLQSQIIDKARNVFDSYQASDKKNFARAQRDVDRLLTKIYQMQARVPKVTSRIEASIRSRESLRIEFENDTLNVEITGVPVLDVSLNQ